VMQEDWAEEVTRDIVPVVIKAHLEGELRKLKPFLGEAVYNKLAADIRTVSFTHLSVSSAYIITDIGYFTEKK
jgi:hypothetical protein